MSNKQTQEYVSPTLEAVTTEIQQRIKEGYVISHGPEYSAGEYVVKFERNAPAEPEVVVEATPAQQPVTPVAAKPARGPKPKKAVAESAKESTEA